MGLSRFPEKQFFFGWNGVFLWLLYMETICTSVPHSRFWKLVPCPPWLKPMRLITMIRMRLRKWNVKLRQRRQQLNTLAICGCYEWKTRSRRRLVQVRHLLRCNTGARTTCRTTLTIIINTSTAREIEQFRTRCAPVPRWQQQKHQPPATTYRVTRNPVR